MPKAGKFGLRIKQLRNAVRLSQNAFAARILRNRSTIANIEGGIIELSPKIRREICDAFKVREDWILTGEGEIFVDGDMSSDISGTRQVQDEQETSKNSFADPPRHPAAVLIPSPDTSQTFIDPALQAMSDIKDIFDSGDPILIPAIQANLNAFKRALLRERQFAQVIQENKELKERLLKLEALCMDIPKLKNKIQELEKKNSSLQKEVNRLKATYEDPNGEGRPLANTSA
ncbi:MAG: helix-turn-helix domain-containing protein [Syntrophaceae bacterium]|nr:helix-turn-helix domain-containing protein [Syntrophaceae bacterium]